NVGGRHSFLSRNRGVISPHVLVVEKPTGPEDQDLAMPWRKTAVAHDIPLKGHRAFDEIGNIEEGFEIVADAASCRIGCDELPMDIRPLRFRQRRNPWLGTRAGREPPGGAGTVSFGVWASRWGRGNAAP